MKDISILLAFSAGLLSFLSPCVLPLVPAYISYLTSTTIEDSKKDKTKFLTLYKAFGFVIGFSIIFILMGLSITFLGKLIITNKDLFRKVGGAIIVLFGVHTLGIIKVKLFYREKRFLRFDRIKGPFSSIIMGIAFAAGWTPCIGPILSTILIYAASMDSIIKGVVLLVIYSLGLAVPFILTAIAIESFTSKLKNFSKYLPFISYISGTLMILIGLMIFTNKLAMLSQYINFINFS